MSNSVSILYQPMTYTLGLYEINCTELRERVGPSDGYDSMVTIGNIIGWIPIIGAIIGAIRFAIGYRRYKEIGDKPGEEMEREAMVGFMIRGMAEICCAGPLLMIIDIIVTIARQIVPPPPSSSELA
jgi:hypothetical protein